MRYLIPPVFFILTALFTGAVQAGDSATLLALRNDLVTGSLRPVLSRQALIRLPRGMVNQWLADIHFDAFAVTGFNENGERFAARVRLRLSDGEEGQPHGVTFVRITGTPGQDYAVDGFRDYASGLELASLVSLKDWLASAAGRDFLSTLSGNPDSPRLAELAGGRSAPLALWLAQCSGLPCESVALKSQPPTDKPALWQLQQAFANHDRDAVEASLSALRVTLGDDPWLWHIAGAHARHQGHCLWIRSPLQAVWREQPRSPELADSALQCTLAGIRAEDDALDLPGTRFLNQLSDQLGSDTLGTAINSYYRQRGTLVPESLKAWITGSKGE